MLERQRHRHQETIAERKMPGGTGDVIVQIEKADGSFECRAFTGVPAARRSFIAIVSSGSVEGSKTAGELGAELEAVLLGSNAEVRVETIDCPSTPDRFDVKADDTQVKVLVLIGSTQMPFQGLPWYDNWWSDEHSAYVMVVLKAGDYGAYFDPAIKDEDLLRRVNASIWQKKVSEVLPGLLARAEITAAVSRIFISYRRVETLPVALQLFDRLVEEGFEVFLDRFSIPPGYDFQRRLGQELEDKSMVLLLESKSLKDSHWTQHEIDFAKRNRLGLVAARMPDVTPGDALTSVSADARLVLDRKDFTGAPVPHKVIDALRGEVTVDEWPKLEDDALQRLVAKVKEVHAAALFRRRYRLRTDVVAALNKGGLATQYSAVGPIRIAQGSAKHTVWLTTRPPEVDDFRSLQGAHAALGASKPSWVAAIIGPRAALEPDRQTRLGWLERMSGCLSFDEGSLSTFIDRLLPKDQA
ncbi:toll/interleukin-1 receptor domain-containing protein [Labrys okinawensis]|uniref:toll/interleukin-1 receptor domain-containing protein n=1 Tax=Labrys okinawensis TaxID=346911 RepID=UPI0039BCF991